MPSACKPRIKKQPPRPQPVDQNYRRLRVGESLQHRAINANIFGQGNKKIVILAGIHGNEPTGVLLAQALMRSLTQQPPPTDLTVIIVPVVNPDGLKLQTRVNAGGSDINRNFPTKNWRPEATKAKYWPGSAPASEPETRAIIELLNDYPPDLLISIHAPLNCINWDGPADKYAQVLSQLNQYPLKPDIGYETPGSLGNYAGKERNIPTITLELRDQDSDINENLPALRALLKYLAEEKEKD